MQTVKIQKVGDKLALLLPEEAVDSLSLQEGDELEVNLADEGGVLLTAPGGLSGLVADAAQRLMSENEAALRELAAR